MSLSPGPWKLSERPLRNAWAVVDAEGHEVCTAFGRDVNGEDDPVAIAKVPEYRELLLTLQGQFQEWIEANQGMDLSNPDCLSLREYWRDRIGALLKDIP